ncbi:MAG: hypothetical protein M1831_000118 [Alyxoria varia]|nr:MAG: hypothetical protein M1831_000118 [Alyxoria varia]
MPGPAAFNRDVLDPKFSGIKKHITRSVCRCVTGGRCCIYDNDVLRHDLLWPHAGLDNITKKRRPGPHRGAKSASKSHPAAKGQSPLKRRAPARKNHSAVKRRRCNYLLKDKPVTQSDVTTSQTSSNSDPAQPTGAQLSPVNPPAAVPGIAPTVHVNVHQSQQQHVGALQGLRDDIQELNQRLDGEKKAREEARKWEWAVSSLKAAEWVYNSGIARWLLRG